MENELAFLAEYRDGVIAADDRGHVVLANEAATEVMGRPIPAGMPLTDLMPKRLQPKHRAGFHRYVTTGQSRLEGSTVRVPAKAADGTEHEVDLTIRIFERPDKTRLAVAGVQRAATGRPPKDLLRVETELQRRLYHII